MTAIYPRDFIADQLGNPVDSGSIYIGTANQDPQTSPIQAYWDAALSVPAAQPITVSAGYAMNAGSRADVYVAESSYSIRIRDRNAVQVDYIASVPNGFITSSGAGLLGYLYSSTYLAGTVGKKLQDTISVKESPFNAKGDDSTDDTDAIYNAIVAAVALNRELYFPGGTYRVTSRKTVTMPNSAVGPQATNYFAQLRVRGDGFSNTVINCTASGWLKVVGSSQQHSVDMQNLTIAAGTAGGFTAIEMDNSAYPFFGEWTAKSRFNVHFRGNDGINNVKYWGTCIDAIDWSNIDFSGSMFDGASTPNGTGVVTRKSVGSYVCVFDFIGCHFRFLSVGYNYGTGSQTANFDACFFAMCTTQIFAPVGGVNHQGLSITNCESFELGTGDGVYLACAVPNFVFTGNRWAVSAGFRGVALDFADQFTITNNQFFPDTTPNTATAAIDIDGTVSGSHGIIDDNNFAGTTVGARLKSGSANIRFGGGNKCTIGMTMVTDAGVGVAGTGLAPNQIGELVAFPAGRIGYGNGAGAAVTQATSKTTGVTINTPCGQITTNNAALAATTEVAFTVTNSAVAATDTIIPQVGSGDYGIRITDAGAGSFIVRLKNLTPGPLSDAVVINFAVIKVVAA